MSNQLMLDWLNGKITFNEALAQAYATGFDDALADKDYENPYE